MKAALEIVGIWMLVPIVILVMLLGYIVLYAVERGYEDSCKT